MDRKEVLEYLREIKEELRQEGIDRIGVFGSVARGSADAASDLDIVIRTTPKFVRRFRGISGFLYFDDLRERLQKRFGRRVDLCDEAGLKNRKVLEDALYA